VQNPLTSLQDDVKATQAVLDRQHGPVILVGHSWGGAVISQVGTESKVSALVFVAAVAPDRGQSVADLMAGSAPMPADSEFQPDGAGSMIVTPKGMTEDFAQDLPVSEARILAATEVPISSQAFHERLSEAAWRRKPSWYLVASRDRALSPDLERKIAQNIGATTVIVPANHLMMLSQPQKVAEAILAAARATAK
jgi:pimeloyl-ACP methyl ester carboxylesterase